MKHIQVSKDCIINLEFVAGTLFNDNRAEVIFSMANGHKFVCDYEKMVITRQDLEAMLLK